MPKGGATDGTVKADPNTEGGEVTQSAEGQKQDPKGAGESVQEGAKGEADKKAVDQKGAEQKEKKKKETAWGEWYTATADCGQLLLHGTDDHVFNWSDNLRLQARRSARSGQA